MGRTPADTFLGSIASQPLTPTREQSTMLCCGLALRPELLGAAELKDILSTHGLSDLWPRVQEAFSFASQAHGAQVRDDGTPYRHHCARAARNAIELFHVRDPDAIQAALLHDVLEDTNTSPAEIEHRFGSKTLAYIQLMSKPAKTESESYEQRNERYLARLESHGSRDLIALKLSDRIDNIDDAHLIRDKSKIARYLEDTRDHYIPLASRHFPEASQTIAARVARVQNWLDGTR